MSDVEAFPEGGYRYLPAIFPFSAGVAAEPGFAVERARLTRLLPLADGFAAAEAHLKALGRPTVALCGIELRSDSLFTAETFQAFNLDYVKVLERWGLYRDGRNPVARTNVVPAFDPPPAPSLYAFSYTVAAPSGTAPSFVTAGGGEIRRNAGPNEDRIVARGDTSPGGLREKMRHVMAEMERRMALLGFSWSDALETNIYTVHAIGPLVEAEIVRGAARGGMIWHFCGPPVIGTEYEMDVRGAMAVRKLAV